MKNHFVPQFALRYWAESIDGKVPYFSRHVGRIVRSRIAPEYTGYEPDLYTFERVPAGQRNTVEEKFFSPLDSAAAPIYVRLERREAFKFTEDQRIIWATFIIAANARVPEKIRMAKDITSGHLVRALEENPEEYLALKGDEPEITLLEWVRNNRPGMIENVGLIQMVKFMTNEQQVRMFMDMEWTVHSVEHSNLELLLGDRPLWSSGRPEAPNYIAIMPLSPRTLFMATRSKEVVRRIAEANPSILVRRANESIVAHAMLRVYGRAPDNFIARCMRKPDGLSSVFKRAEV